ncbi:beta-lactamase [Kribbella amoyensis]|uniref:Beta-lactamase n=1 Tax=Kribbella amoyensis TaxID=996641 RepID=A0A561BL73_9ACTN|nr:serine hydrolase domain-containing protein [Kribbella amoyensis]TWD79640.1 beta-lactamase [Kribbella amoyensis]
MVEEEGLVDLDRPVREYLPEFGLSDSAAAKVVTARHLLTHTSGFAGDAFISTSRGDDAVELFLTDVLPGLPQEIPPGAGFSYNNSGFVVLGRITEVLRGKPFHVLVRERIGEPLGLEHLATVPEEALLHRAALGHVTSKPGGPHEPAPVWSLIPAMGPAGSLLAMSARDLVTFGQAYLENKLVSAETRELLWTPEVDVPDLGGFAQHWGLGWMIFDVEGGRMYGHDGGTIGQSAYFRVIPDQGVVIALLTNGTSQALYHDLVGHLLGELAGYRHPARPVPPEQAPRIAPELYLGRYDAVLTSTEITATEDSEIWAEETPRTDEARALMPEVERRRMVPLDADRLITAEPDRGEYQVLAFRQPGADGRAAYLFRGGRLIPRGD